MRLPRLKRLILFVLITLTSASTQATPYASGLTNNAGVVSFILNEDAGNVTVTLNPGGSTLDLGALGKGPHDFNLGAATSFQIVVRKVASAGWSLISSDTNTFLQFPTPRGVAVNMNTNSPQFGRIYVANSAAGTTGTGRTVGDGLYLLNPDQTDALGRGDTASTAGIAFDAVGGTSTPGANSPWRLEVGPDGSLYIADFSTNTGNIYRTDADVSPSSGINMLENFGITNQTVHTTIGSSPVISGSLANNDLTIWAIDGRFPPATGNNNRLYRWDIGGGPLPYANPPVPLATPLINNVADVTTDLARGPDGKFYMMQNRSVGNESGIVVVDDTGLNVLWRSLAESQAQGSNVDILRISRAVAISPDGQKMAIVRDDLQTWVIPLVNGIPDLTNRELVITYSGAPTTLGRDIAWDAAGNLYVVSSGNQLLRVFSPGGATTATTGSDGTFQVSVVRLPQISVTGGGNAYEAGPPPASFTLTRTEDPSAELTVEFTLTGTATNGVDYVTIPTSVTFAAGSSTATVEIAAINDTLAEPTETVVLTLLSGTNYIAVAPTSANINIVDDEYPNAVTVSTVDTNAYERFASDPFSFRLTRFGDTNIEIFVDVALSGAAVAGVDFGPITNTIFFPQGTVTLDLPFAPINDNDIEGNETVTLSVINGGDYVAGNPGSATLRIRDDELPAAPVLFSDNFETDSSANWLVRFGGNDGIYDATSVFAYNYTDLGIPLAPRSAAGTSKGLYVAVNKDANGSPAGINFYPAGQTFSGDFSLRFDMYLSFGTAGTTEHALAGINHSSLQTNRVTQSADPNNTTAGGDGVWVAIETDGSANRDYTAYSTPNPANPPVTIASQTASAMAPYVTSPPFAFAGSPGVNGTSEKAWSTVELSQIANVVTLKVDAATVFTFTNTTGFTSGDIMLGLNDQFASIGSAENFVIFDNVEVVSLSSGSSIRITGISFPSPGIVAIDFTATGGGAAGDFHLQSTATLLPVSWSDDASATITATANGFRATTAVSGDQRYYQIRR